MQSEPSRSCLLIGPGGSGKTQMACLTAVRKPVHIVDLDNKVFHQDTIREAIAKGDVTVSHFNEKLTNESLVERALRLSLNEKPKSQPKGWLRISQLIEDLPLKEPSKNAETWVIDSLTVALDHLVQLVLYSSPKGKGFMSTREWGIFLQMCKETITNIREGARHHKKDLIVIVHERFSEIPKENETKIFYDDEERKVIGNVDWKITASVPGQFGNQITTYFEEVYALEARANKNGEVNWICRVHPDGVRDLRCSFNTKGKHEFSPPDFRQIWK